MKLRSCFLYVFVIICCLQVMSSILHSSWFERHSTLIDLVFCVIFRCGWTLPYKDKLLMLRSQVFRLDIVCFQECIFEAFKLGVWVLVFCSFEEASCQVVLVRDECSNNYGSFLVNCFCICTTSLLSFQGLIKESDEDLKGFRVQSLLQFGFW